MPFASSHHCEIFYESLGEGPAVVLAHGRGGNAASWFQQVPAFVTAGYRVIAFDHRCFGRSHCPPEHFDRAHFADDLAAVLDAAGVDRAAVVCQSMGGWTGLRLAVQRPDRVAALVLANTTGGVSTPAADTAIAEARQAFAQHGIASSAVAADFPEREPALAYLYRHIGGLNVQLTDDLHSNSPASTSAEELAALALPVLLVTSDADTIFPPAAIREIAGLIPGSTVCQLPDAGHSPYFETPAAWNAAVLDFLSRRFPPG
ncbi:MAG: alpha/beta fold hydrolase [Alphaproteobacteria bacterium]|nr:alpha/beta fold hydrolase [Alphaproteobacteria bacterium]MCB9927932.1 alpha/beta fold hydrolase [Alphaproteobacteria bacterium]